MKPGLFAAICALCCLVLSGCQSDFRNSNGGNSGQEFSLEGQTMGTYYRIKYVLSDALAQQTPSDTVQAAVEFELKRVNSLMSTYDENSELSQINQSESTEDIPVSPDTGAVLRLAWKIAQQTDGAYDPTVGALVNLWRFGPEARPERVPTDQEIAEAKRSVGYQKIKLFVSKDQTEDKSLAIKKEQADVYIDLSSVAKGFGVDCVAEMLLERGINRFLIDIGGELRAAGRNKTGEPWQIGIQRPQLKAGPLMRIVSLENRAIATSGNYLNFYEENGVRYSHLIDPKTGKPIRHRTASVTVIAPTCAEADAWATALIVLGSEKGQILAKKNHLQATFIDKIDNGFSTIEIKDNQTP